MNPQQSDFWYGIRVWFADGCWYADCDDPYRGSVSGSAEVVLATVGEWMGQ